MVWNKWRSVSNCGVLLLGKKKCDRSFCLCACVSQGELKIPLLWHSSEAWLASQPLAGGHAVHGNETTTCPSETEVKWTSPLSPSHLHAIFMSQTSLPSGSHISCVCVHVLLNCSGPARALDSSPLFDSLNPCLILSHTGWIDGHADTENAAWVLRTYLNITNELLIKWLQNHVCHS